MTPERAIDIMVEASLGPKPIRFTQEEMDDVQAVFAAHPETMDEVNRRIEPHLPPEYRRAAG